MVLFFVVLVVTLVSFVAFGFYVRHQEKKWLGRTLPDSSTMAEIREAQVEIARRKKAAKQGFTPATDRYQETWNDFFFQGCYTGSCPHRGEWLARNNLSAKDLLPSEHFQYFQADSVVKVRHEGYTYTVYRDAYREFTPPCEEVDEATRDNAFPAIREWTGHVDELLEHGEELLRRRGPGKDSE